MRTKAAVTDSVSLQSTALIEGINRRIFSHWKLKLGMTLGLNVFFLSFYSLLQRVIFFTPRELSLNSIDRWVEFSPVWIWVYVSLYLLIPLFPLFSIKVEELLEFTVSLVLFCSISFLVFAFFPIECPRPDHISVGGLYDLLVVFDTKFNSFPSLHCALALYAVLFGQKCFFKKWSFLLRIPFWGCMWVWVALIAYSTLATKQHYFVDILGGFFVALVGHLFLQTQSGMRLLNSVHQFLNKES